MSLFYVSEFELMHVDEFIDELLHSERVCDIILPHLQVRLHYVYTDAASFMCPHCWYLFLLVWYASQKRQVLEEAEMLDPRISALEEDLDEVESSEEEDEEEEKVNAHCSPSCLNSLTGGNVVLLWSFMKSVWVSWVKNTIFSNIKIRRVIKSTFPIFLKALSGRPVR